MNPRSLLALSVCANALLLCGVLALSKSRARPPSPTVVARAETTPAAPAPHRFTRITRQAPPPGVAEVAAPFHWAQVESADYKVFIANLRGIGCPEATVRDIVIADIDGLFAGRVKAQVDGVTGRFWHLVSRHDEFEKLVTEKHKELQKLDDERDELFKELFGDRNPLADEEKVRQESNQRQEFTRRAGFLPPEMQARVQELDSQLERDTAALHDEKLPPTERQKNAKALRDAHTRALRDLMTPGEFEEWRLRDPALSRVRDELAGLDATPDALRSLLQIRLEQQDATSALTPGSPDYKKRKVAIDRQAEARIKEDFFPGRHEELQRARDPRFQVAYQVAERLELPAESAVKVFEAQKLAQESATQIGRNRGLSAEERQARLQALGTQAREAISAALGDQGLRAYERHAGDWLKPLAKPAP